VAFPYEEFDLSGVRTYPLDSRVSKARVEDFARPVTTVPPSRSGSHRCRGSWVRKMFIAQWMRLSRLAAATQA
jgi:hypothetical protein